MPATRSRSSKPNVGTMYREFPVLKFTGLNTRDTSIHIDDSQSPDLMNVHFDNKGEITKRNGYAVFSMIDTNPVVSIFSYFKSSGTNYMLSTSMDKVYNITSGTAVSIKTGLSSNNRFTSTTYKDALYMMNGSDGLMKWDGTTFSIVPSMPGGKYVLVHKNRLYICGDPANPSRVYFSDLGSPESFPALNFTDINTNDGDVITGMAEHLDSLVIFKERSIHVLRGTGPQNFVMVDSHQSRGTVSHWTIVSIQNHLYYLARDGVYYYDGKQIHLASDVIRGSVMGLNNNSVWNQTNLSKACAVDYGHKYWLAIPEGGSQLTNNRIYLLDYTHGTWTRYDIPVSCFCLYPNISSLYSGSPSTGKVYTQDTGTSDDTANITAYCRTKDFDFGAPAHYKTFKGLLFEAREAAAQYSINISYIEDFDRATKTVALNLGPIDTLWDAASWDVDAWGSLARIVTKTTAVSGQSRYLAFKVTDTSQNPWSFIGWIIRYQVKRRLG